MLRRAYATAVAAFVGSLSPVLHAEGAPLKPQILNGTESPAATYGVALCQGLDPKNCTVYCSGTLLAPNVVLTARHCAATKLNGADCSTQTFSSPLQNPTYIWVTNAMAVVPSAQHRRGVRWDIPASLYACGPDLALLTLAEPFTSTTLAAPITTAKPIENAPRDALTALGYGGGGTGSTKFASRKAIGGISVQCLGGTDRQCKALVGGRDLQKNEFATTAQVCPGDSGSGLFDASNVTYGVLSRLITGGEECSSGVYVSLEEHLLLLARVTKQATTSAKLEVPAWVGAAETLGNGGGFAPRALGAPCDTSDDCESGQCRSLDRGLNFKCSKACDEVSCPSDFSCRTTDDGKFCFSEPTRDPGCSAGSLDDTRAPALAVALSLAIVASLARRARSRAR